MKCKIGKVSELMSMSIHTLRYYEKIGLVTPERDEYNNRIYSENDINRLKMIINFKLVDTPLNKIQTFFSFFGNENEMENRKKFLVDEQVKLGEMIESLQRGRSFISQLLSDCYKVEK